MMRFVLIHTDMHSVLKQVKAEEEKGEYNNAIVAFCSLDVEFILQKKASRGHRVSKTEENLNITITRCLKQISNQRIIRRSKTELSQADYSCQQVRQAKFISKDLEDNVISDSNGKSKAIQIQNTSSQAIFLKKRALTFHVVHKKKK